MGVHAARLGRPKEVLGLLNSLGATPHCLRVISRGHLEHPLRLPSSCELRPFEGSLRGHMASTLLCRHAGQ